MGYNKNNLQKTNIVTQQNSRTNDNRNNVNQEKLATLKCMCLNTDTLTNKFSKLQTHDPNLVAINEKLYYKNVPRSI